MISQWVSLQGTGSGSRRLWSWEDTGRRSSKASQRTGDTTEGWRLKSGHAKIPKKTLAEWVPLGVWEAGEPEGLRGEEEEGGGKGRSLKTLLSSSSAVPRTCKPSEVWSGLNARKTAMPAVWGVSVESSSQAGEQGNLWRGEDGPQKAGQKQEDLWYRGREMG